jgi:hypothetical protein
MHACMGIRQESEMNPCLNMYVYSGQNATFDTCTLQYAHSREQHVNMCRDIYIMYIYIIDLQDCDLPV